MRMSRGQAERFPDANWLHDMAEAAQQWALHRGVEEKAVILAPGE
ncbi:hypothetical protein [Streptomyces sp. NA02950]|nr:hypothetical protein [Streptomyces sp. NA02950]